MQVLFDAIQRTPAYQRLVTDLRAGVCQRGLDLPRAARLPVAASLHRELGWPLVLITDRADRALALADELSFWAAERPCYVFSEPNPLFYEDAAWGSTTRRERLHALTALAVYHLPFSPAPEVAPIIVTSARALMTRSLPRRDFLKASRLLRSGARLSPAALLEDWLRIGYQPADTVLEHGQFSHRGGLLDIWPVAEPNPVRLDFFGDDIETIRQFDPASQRTIASLDAILVTPGREFLLPAGTQQDRDFPDQPSEFHLPLLHRYTSSLLDYLPAESLVLVDNLSSLDGTITEFEEQAVRFRTESIAEGVLSDDFPVPYYSWSELSDQLTSLVCVELGYSGETPDEDPVNGTGVDASDKKLGSVFGQLQRFAGRLKPFSGHLRDLQAARTTVIVVSRQAARLEELWMENVYLDDRTAAGDSAALKPVTFVEASLSGGFSFGDLRLITDSEVFGWERPQPRHRQRPLAETPESAYADLDPGDWVVHVDYGIGKFGGLVRRTLENLEREFLCVEYRNGDQVFVPIHQADRLTRYIGPDGGPPSASHLGGQEWPETKRRVKEAVQQVAEELLGLYAQRQVVEGFAFSMDSPWQSELESSFPYIETEDQEKALLEIKRDMETPRPMDRLLCGDVGYGKTEVALRAAFKAVMDGKQVAVLVPTTVLAQQHYDTFKQRLAAFPVTVEMLSRFRTPREQAQVLYGLSEGAVDIVIGTHRLIQADVQFKDLGLVVVDEEQRFGVTHKEHLKQLRTEVDVLTLTATPIPRTLYMALTGVRDISNLNTPPEERLPIITHVGPYSPKLVRQAILREVERGGQVFFVHNRVQTIEAMKMHLDKIIPGVHAAIAHGQMPEQELAAVMRSFTAGDVDVLLATSIIESGLDIPNANTLIVDRADAFGLAQLYQLRGRVGRGAMRAYAYFFRHRKLMPTIEGQERLDVIAENTQLGAGYSIAMRDLEIRGAGDLLGTRQSGYIASVGFHLYTRLLAGAVRGLRRVRGLPDPVQPASILEQEVGLPVNVDLPLASGIQAEYIPDQTLRLRLYRRLADMTDEAALEALSAEFSDRFGQLPEMVTNLFFQMQVKLAAERSGLVSVSTEGGQIVLRYPPGPEGIQPRRLPDLGPRVRGGKNAYWYTFAKDEDWRERLLEILESLTKQ
ncbi:MAG: transcription-repair coupling factor [Chloroflexota bacterium]